MEFLSSLYSSTIIPQGSHKLLKRYIRAKKLDSPDGKKVVRQGLLYLVIIKGLLATSTSIAKFHVPFQIWVTPYDHEY